MFKSKSSMMIVSLLVAIAVWLYVMGEVDPVTRAKITAVPVNFVNTEVLASYGLAVACDDQVSISVSVSGKRSDVNAAKKSGLTASVDVAECEMGENTQKITVNLPDGTKLENISQTTMTVEVEELVYQYKPVEISFTGSESSGDSASETVPWVMSCYPEQVSVSGARSSVDKIVKLIGTVESSEAKPGKENQVTADLIPVNKNGKEIKNITLHTEHAEAAVSLLSVRSAALQVTAANGDIKLDSLNIPGNVRIAGHESDIRNIKVVEGVVSSDDEKIYIDTDLPENVFIMIGEDNGKIIWN